MVVVTILYLEHAFQGQQCAQMVPAGGICDLKLKVKSEMRWGEDFSHCRLLHDYSLPVHIDLSILDEITGNKVSYSWYESFLDLGEALEKLEEITHEPEYRVSYVREAAIQRFEFCIELFWQILKKMGESEGREANSQKEAIRMAYSLNLIDNKAIWLAMLENRNQTSHTYKKTLTKEIYKYIPFYYEVMQSAYDALKKRFRV